MNDFDQDFLFPEIEEDNIGTMQISQLGDLDKTDLHFNSFANGDDLRAMNEEIVNNDSFQSNMAPKYENNLNNGGVIVTDIFGGKHHYVSMEEANNSVDIMSGLQMNIPSMQSSLSNNEHESTPSDMQSLAQMKLDRSEELEHERDIAVEKYHEVMRCDDLDEALKWQDKATDKQESLYTLWDTPRYTSGRPKVPGID